MRTSLFFGWIVVLCGSLLSACQSAPVREFADADLLISEGALPTNWALTEDGVSERIPRGEGEESGAAVSFYATDTIYDARMIEYVYRYSSAGKAAWHYDRREKEVFNDASFYRTSPWQVPSGFTFSSSLANKWRFGCAGSSFTIGPSTGSTSTICTYLAQYDEFLVVFHADRDIDGSTVITVSELQQVVEAIDQKMSENLNPTPPP